MIGEKNCNRTINSPLPVLGRRLPFPCLTRGSLIVFVPLSCHVANGVSSAAKLSLVLLSRKTRSGGHAQPRRLVARASKMSVTLRCQNSVLLLYGIVLVVSLYVKRTQLVESTEQHREGQLLCPLAAFVHGNDLLSAMRLRAGMNLRMKHSSVVRR